MYGVADGMPSSLESMVVCAVKTSKASYDSYLVLTSVQSNNPPSICSSLSEVGSETTSPYHELFCQIAAIDARC